MTLREQMGTHTERGQARGLMCAFAPTRGWGSDNPAVANAISYSRATMHAGVPSCRHLPTSRPGQLGLRAASFSVGFVGALDELAESVTLDRAGAFVGSRPRFLNSSDHLARQSSDRSKTHPSVLSRAALPTGPTVGKGSEKHVPEIEE